MKVIGFRNDIEKLQLLFDKLVTHLFKPEDETLKVNLDVAAGYIKVELPDTGCNMSWVSPTFSLGE
jgi:hypothetical protein